MPKKLLVVDDEESMRRLYSRVFSGGDYAFTLAGSFGEAKDLLRENSYDLLITDLILGDGDGTDLIKLIKAAGSKTKAIVISGALGESEMDNLASEYGLPACFCKPFNTDTLLSLVKNLLN